jgi:hypothetical protein
MGRGMIQEVFILGQIGRAVYEQDDRYYVIGVTEPSTPVECRPGEISLLFDSGTEVSVLHSERIDSEAIKGTLETSAQNYRGLSMTLAGLDSELTTESRVLAIEAAEELFQGKLVRQFVRKRLLARQLPDSADINGAIEQGKAANASSVSSLYEEVKAAQGSITALNML